MPTHGMRGDFTRRPHRRDWAVHPPLGAPVIYGERGADCPVCGAAIMRTGPNKQHGHSGSWEDETLACSRRHETRMHGECYWGRVATLAEWQEHRRQIAGGPEDYGRNRGVPAVSGDRAPDERTVNVAKGRGMDVTAYRHAVRRQARMGNAKWHRCYQERAK